MVRALVLLLVLAVTPLWAGRDYQSRLCPMEIPTGERMNPKLERVAWKRAKRMVGAPRKWKRPGVVVRFGDYLEAEEGTIAGLYYDPVMYLDFGTGRIAVCEYVVLHLPLDTSDELVMHVLIHEYLHSLEWRLRKAGAVLPGCEDVDSRLDGCERWVQEVLPHPEGWNE